MPSATTTSTRAPKTFACAQEQGTWTVVGAVTTQTPQGLRTAVDAAELDEHFDLTKASGQVVVRSGEKHEFSAFQQVSGEVLIPLQLDTHEELAGARIEWTGAKKRSETPI